MIALELHNLTLSYAQKPALWNVDFSIPETRLVGVIGPNGSGKSTMLKTVMGLVEAEGGLVKIYEQPLEEVRKRIAYVPQRSSVDWDFPVNAMDVVLMGRQQPGKLFYRPSKADKEIAKACLEKVQMLPFAKRQISQLSGGQQQRVFIARALAQEADLYLLDEPFAGVDAATENSVMELLKELTAAGKTVVVVHHDLQTVYDYFDWLVMLNTRLIASGPTKEVFTAENLKDTYGGRLNILSRVAELIRSQEHPMRE